MAVRLSSASQSAAGPATRVLEFGTVTVTALRTASLGNWSYLISSDGESVVVDPQRDAERYAGLPSGHGSRLRHIIETHIHSDYLSGALSLAAETGARIVAARRGRYEFAHQPVDDGDELSVGGIVLRCLATPGHTFEHVSWQLTDADSATPLAVLSGGSLLRTGAGRTDLSGADATEELTRLQFDSIRRLSSLGGDALLLPTHDGGSTCSVGIVSADGIPWWDLPSEPDEFPSITHARVGNRYLALPGADEFAAEFLGESGPAPAYFRHVARLNREGVPQEQLSRDIARLSAAEFARLPESAWVVDIRNRWMFADAHVAGSLNIEPNDAFAVHVGSLVPFGAAVAVVAEERDMELIDDLAVNLFRIGYRLAAVLDGGIEAWVDDGYPTTSYPSADMMEIIAEASHGTPHSILDVREPSEWSNGVVGGSRRIPVAGLGDAMGDLRQHSSASGDGSRLTVACHGGARAAVAASYLARHDIPVRAILGGGVPDAAVVRGFSSIEWP